MYNLVTQHLKLKDVYPDKAKEVAKTFNKKEEDLEFIRKGINPEDLRFNEGENSVVGYISTKSIDRDREIVVPEGVMLDDYRKTPVVLWCHDYSRLPIGKNIWIKCDDKGLIAKTVYNVKESFSRSVFEYRKDGFPLANSIGFIPLEYTDLDPETNSGARRRYDSVLLLEYSDVPVPSNPDAVQIAVSKGLIPESEKEEYLNAIKEEEKKEVEATLKEGRVLSKKNRTLIEETVKALQNLLEATDKSDNKQPEEVEPDDNGDCPEGYELEGDMCILKGKATPKPLKLEDIEGVFIKVFMENIEKHGVLTIKPGEKGVINLEPTEKDLEFEDEKSEDNSDLELDEEPIKEEVIKEPEFSLEDITAVIRKALSAEDEKRKKELQDMIDESISRAKGKMYK